MSGLAKSTFAVSCVVSVGLVAYVHYEQHSDRTKLHSGVIKDVERQNLRKMQNLQDLQQQISLTERLQKELEESERVTAKIS